MNRFAFVVTMLVGASIAGAQPTDSPPQEVPGTPTTPPNPPATPEAPDGPPVPQSTLSMSASPQAPKDEPKKGPKEPQRGDFDAGGQTRFPSGPDEMGAFDSFNWVALDLKGRYYLLKTVTVNGNIPLAVKKPDTINAGMTDPSLIGGMTVNLDARVPVPKMPFIKNDVDVGLSLTLGYMREGAMLLSDKDYPLFTGGFQPGFAGGLITKIKLSSLLDFSLLPTWVIQKGEMDSLTAVQIPMALQVALGSLLKLNAELGVYTGDDYSFSGDNGGRIATGASLDVKLGPILVHAGAGVASLLTGGVYPTISDSFYVDLNVKYAK